MILTKIREALGDYLVRRAQKATHAAFPDSETRIMFHLSEAHTLGEAIAFGQGNTLHEIKMVTEDNYPAVYMSMIPHGAENEELGD